MNIQFGHHLSLSYRGGGEKWLTNLANELICRGHEVSVKCLPFWKRDNPIELFPEVDYEEGIFHSLDGDVNYITYNPLNWLNFHVHGPVIGGFHSHCYWQPLMWKYGLLPNLANLVHKFTKKRELKRFDAIHLVSPVYPVDAEKVYTIPYFVDSKQYFPEAPKNDEFTINFASRKVWQKGYDVFLELQKLMGGVDDVQFQCSGIIPENKMPSFYSRGHVTVVPTRVDLFGRVNVESLLCGTPVISSGLDTHRVLDLPIIYANKLGQYVVAIDNLKRMSENGLYKSISEICRSDALKYDKNVIVDQLENMFEEVSCIDR